jgi:hypothetical protein
VDVSRKLLPLGSCMATASDPMTSPLHLRRFTSTPLRSGENATQRGSRPLTFPLGVRHSFAFSPVDVSRKLLPRGSCMATAANPMTSPLLPPHRFAAVRPRPNVGHAPTLPSAWHHSFPIARGCLAEIAATRLVHGDSVRSDDLAASPPHRFTAVRPRPNAGRAPTFSLVVASFVRLIARGSRAEVAATRIVYGDGSDLMTSLLHLHTASQR